MNTSLELRLNALLILAQNNVDTKCSEVDRLFQVFSDFNKPDDLGLTQTCHQHLVIDTLSDDCVLTERAGIAPETLPGRPEQPVLVHATHVAARGFHTEKARASMLHAIAHIEFNAINLALDAIWRFNAMPTEYYLDWLRVAKEEAYHFQLLCAHLLYLGFRYGDFAAHNGLWEMCEKTKDDVLARMALVPRLMEARGLDVTPAIQAKFKAAGDWRAVEILDTILRDEIGHVAIGNRWFHYCCRQRQLDYQLVFRELMHKHRAPPTQPPLNMEARLQGGFELEELEQFLASTS